MQKVPVKTSKYGFGRMIHVVHMSDDAAAMTAWYEKVFGAVTYMGPDGPTMLPVEDRWATLVVFGEMCIEPMAPNFPVNETLPVGKFYSRFGNHLHSIGYQVDDLYGLGEHLLSKGVYIGRPGGGQVESFPIPETYFYPRPPDTGGVMVELCATPMPSDPRDMEFWSSMAKLWDTHPLGLKGLGFVTFGARDADKSAGMVIERLLGEDLGEQVNDELMQRSRFVRVGDAVMEFAQPLDENTELAAHVAKYGNFIYGITLTVADLDRAQAHLESVGLTTSRPGKGLLALDPAQSFGAYYHFTDQPVPGA